MYRLDATTNATAAPLRLVLEGLAMPNGIGFSPAGDVLYVSDTGRPVGRDLLRSRPPVVAAFDVARLLAGGPGAAEPLWQTTQNSDGLCVTHEGVVVLTSRLLFFQGLVLLDPLDGAILGTLPLPEAPTNVACRTPDPWTFFVTAETTVFRVTLEKVAREPRVDR